MIIQHYQEELDYVNAQLRLRGFTEEAFSDAQSFLGTFLLACLRADAENYEQLRPALAYFTEKYPAPAEHLAAESGDNSTRGRT